MSSRANGRALARPKLEVPTRRDVAALVARLALLSADRASIATEEAEILAKLAESAENLLADLADQSVTSTVSQQVAAKPPPVCSPREPELLGKKQVAEMLGCCTKTVYRLELEGRFPDHVTVGRRKLWERKRLRAWIDEGGSAKRSARR